jgi:hypothetical protein
VIWKLLAKFLAVPWVADGIIWWVKESPYYHLPGYMNRWWLFNPDIDEDGNKKYPNCPFSIRVHHILRADADRYPHCHPGDFRTVILKGYYSEVRRYSEHINGILIHRAGDTTTLDEDSYHSVSTVSPGGVWTLFILWQPRMRKPGSWGFLVNGEYVPWRKYLQRRDQA